jgi:DNA-binding HxlR family transcriptional regulator/transposase
MTPLRGRSVRGERLMADAPFGRRQTQTFVAGLRCHKLVAPWIIEGVYIRTQLAPCLERSDVVILDNLNVHKSPRAAQALALAKRGAWFLFLPKYSPHLNPIEMAFAKLKTLLRKAKARTYDALWPRRRGHLRPVRARRMLELPQRDRVCCRLIARCSSKTSSLGGCDLRYDTDTPRKFNMRPKAGPYSECPIARAVETVGESRSLLILRDAFQGFTRFNKFRQSLGIAPHIFSRRLAYLTEAGLFEQRLYRERPPRYF